MEDRDKAVKKYNKLKEKYELPALNALEEEFEFELDDTNGIIKTITHQVWDKITLIKSFIEGVLHPQRYCCITETGFLNPKSKEKIFNFYRLIMAEYWRTIKASFENEERKAEQLKNSYEFYQEVKKFSQNYTQKMIKGWEETEETEEKNGYIN